VSTKTPYRAPADLRDRMVAATRRGTNLDPNPTTRNTGGPGDSGRPATRSSETIERRRERAKIAARERRAREKAERLRGQAS
jgi:hypothetical protein